MVDDDVITMHSLIDNMNFALSPWIYIGLIVFIYIFLVLFVLDLK